MSEYLAARAIDPAPIRGPKWFAVFTKLAAEGRVYLGIEAAGFIAFCPFERSSHRDYGRQCVRIQPVFPRYIFAQCEPDLIGRIREIDGVEDILQGQADDATIDRLRRLRDMGGFDNTGARWAHAGQQVSVTDSAMGKLLAKIKNTPAHKRLKRLELDGDFPFRVTAIIDKLQRVKA